MSSTAMLTFESLPVELISDILGETDVKSLIGQCICPLPWFGMADGVSRIGGTVVSGLSRKLREIISNPSLNPWRRPILRVLRRGDYSTDLANLGLRMIVPKYNWIEITSKGVPEFLLFEATVPNLNEHEWYECFRRRFLPSWTCWKKDSSWRIAFHKCVLEVEDETPSLRVLVCRVLYRVWHRTHSSCTADEAWTRFVTGFHPVFVFLV